MFLISYFRIDEMFFNQCKNKHIKYISKQLYEIFYETFKTLS